MLIRLLTFIVFIISTALPAVAETTWNAYVVNVEDGNTISVSTKHGSDEPEAVLIFYGIEAPSHNQPFGPEAVAYLKSVMDNRPFKRVYEPGNPDANAEGYVMYPDINVVEEMANLMTAQRNYEANVTTVDAVKGMFIKALDIGR